MNRFAKNAAVTLAMLMAVGMAWAAQSVSESLPMGPGGELDVEVLSGTVTITADDVVEVFAAVASGSYEAPLMMWGINTGGIYMRSYPYSEGDGSNIHRADDGASSTTPCFASKYEHTTFSAYLEIA